MDVIIPRYPPAFVHVVLCKSSAIMRSMKVSRSVKKRETRIKDERREAILEQKSQPEVKSEMRKDLCTA